MDMPWCSLRDLEVIVISSTVRVVILVIESRISWAYIAEHFFRSSPTQGP